MSVSVSVSVSVCVYVTVSVCVVDQHVLTVVSVLSLRGASGEEALLSDYAAPPATAKPITRC